MPTYLPLVSAYTQYLSLVKFVSLYGMSFKEKVNRRTADLGRLIVECQTQVSLLVSLTWAVNKSRGRKT